MGSLIGLEIQIESNERPIAMVPFLQSFFHDRTNALKEILLHGWLVAVGASAMGDDGP